MKKTLLSALIVALVPMAQASADVSGNWKIEGDIGGMPVSILCKLADNASKVSGVCNAADLGDLQLKEGSSTADSVSFTYDVNYQGQTFTVTYNGKLASPTELKGDIAVGGNPSGSFTGKKQ